jgi:hypothetical protein
MITYDRNGLIVYTGQIKYQNYDERMKLIGNLENDTFGEED